MGGRIGNSGVQSQSPINGEFEAAVDFTRQINRCGSFYLNSKTWDTGRITVSLRLVRLQSSRPS